MKQTRLLLADDHTLVIAGIRKLVENEFDLVGTAEDGRAVLRAAEELQPDIILLDITMPLLNGIDACRQLQRFLPHIKIIFLTMHTDMVYVEEALRAGASGYLVKRSAASELSHAVHAVIRGDKYVTSLINYDKPDNRQPAISSKPKEPADFDKLTLRQREVLQLVAEGRANKEIAGLLHISEKTVDYHTYSIQRELLLGSTAELTQYAINHRIIDI